MISVDLGWEDTEDKILLSGDGPIFIEDTFTIMAQIYQSLMQRCPSCARLYKNVFSDPEEMLDFFEEVEKDLKEKEGIEMEECNDCEDMEDDLFDYEEDIDESYDPLISQEKDGFKGGNGLFGADIIKFKKGEK